LNDRFLTDFQSSGKTKIKNYLKLFLPNRFIKPFLEIAKVDLDKNLAIISKEDKKSIVSNLKSFKIKINGIVNYNGGMVSCGGVCVDEIDSKTMESKIVPGLYFAGEILEPYGPTGGYNLQIAFSTGYLAGLSASVCFKP